MSILPQGYANITTPVFETNQTPDSINVINGSEGIIATRVGNTVNLTTGVLDATSPFSVQSVDGSKSFTIIQNNDGTDLINTFDGSINVASSQGPSNVQLSMGINPFTGTSYIANLAPNTLNGNIQLFCGAGPLSSVDIISQPGAGSAGGLTIYNGTAAGPSCNIQTSSSGTMELSGSNGNIELIANVANLQGAIFTPATGVGAGGFTIQNGNTGPAPETTYTFYNSTLDGGGLTAGNLEIFGYSGSGPTIRRCLTTNPVGSTMTLGDDSIVGGANIRVAGVGGPSRVYDGVFNKPTNASATGVNIAPLITGTGTATLPIYKPLMIDGSGNLVVPNQPLFRYFGITTPNSTTTAIKIVDPEGNDFDNSWICCVAGFYNTGNTTLTPDRTYACWTQPPSNSTFTGKWSIEYDNGGTSPQYVWILAISTQLYGYVNYNA